MTRNQYESHTEQMEAHRLAFMEHWNFTVLPVLTEEKFSQRKIMSIMQGAWESWLDDAKIKCWKSNGEIP